MMNDADLQIVGDLAAEQAERFAFGVFASGAMRGGATLEKCRVMFACLPVEDRARWLQRGRDTITYALSYVP
jgi:hypothetical protein